MSSVAVAGSGQIVSGSADETVKVWDGATGECVQTLAGHNGSLRLMVDGMAATGGGRW